MIHSKGNDLALRGFVSIVWVLGVGLTPELVGCTAGGGGNGRANADSDGDGFSDREEMESVPGSDPMNPDDTPENPIDSDGDGCSDYDESNFEGFGDENPDSPLVDDPDASFRFDLTIARQVSHAFSEAQVDAKLADAGAVLQSVETACPDVATDVTFQRTGALSTFDGVPAVITTERQLDAAFDLPFDIKIVQAMVGVCGVFDPGGVSIILGCAATGGSLVIVSEADPDVWAHEWGHVQGLPHRDDCPRNIMHAFELSTNAVNDAERAAFLTPTPKIRVPRLAMPPTGMEEPGELLPGGDARGGSALEGSHDAAVELARFDGEPLDDWLKRILQKHYLAGVPAAVFAFADPEWAIRLTALLDEDDTVGYRRNVVRAMGFCRQPEVCGRLLAMIASSRGELTFDEFGCVVESLLALGRLAALDVSGVALTYLMEQADAGSAESDGAPTWSYGAVHGNTTTRVMSRLAVMALGLTGDDRALQYLVARRQAMTDARSGDSAMLEQLDESIARLSGSSPVPSTVRMRRTP